jgi:hypothetical protein
VLLSSAFRPRAGGGCNGHQLLQAECHAGLLTRLAVVDALRDISRCFVAYRVFHPCGAPRHLVLSLRLPRSGRKRSAGVLTRLNTILQRELWNLIAVQILKHRLALVTPSALQMKSDTACLISLRKNQNVPLATGAMRGFNPVTGVAESVAACRTRT